MWCLHHQSKGVVVRSMLGCYVFLKGRGECGVCITKAASRLTVDPSQASARGIGELSAPGRVWPVCEPGERLSYVSRVSQYRRLSQSPLSYYSGRSVAFNYQNLYSPLLNYTVKQQSSEPDLTVPVDLFLSHLLSLTVLLIKYFGFTAI